MRGKKVLIIGIDSLEGRFINDIVNYGVSKGFSFFLKHGVSATLRSTFPPDTFLAWPTIYTGLLHQRFNLKPEPESPSVMMAKSLIVRDKIAGKTFWDIASIKGKRVCIINPIFAYPPWDVNGLMVTGPSFGLKGSPLSKPARKDIASYKLGTYGSAPLLPHEYKKVLNETLRQLVDVFKMTYKFFDEESYDLMFVADYTLDRIQHYYWRFYDPKDPLNPKILNTFRKVITNYYILIDSFIKKFIEKFSGEYIIVVFGDHGHTMRPTRLLSIDRLLNPTSSVYTLRELLKSLTMLGAYYSGTSNFAYWLIRKLQERGLMGRIITVKKEKFTKSERLAIISLSEFGLKEYVGLKIQIKDDFKSFLINKLKGNLIQRGLAEFVVTPSEYYGVGNLNYEADLYLKLKDMGNAQTKSSFMIIPNYTRRIISGGHGLHSLLLLYDSEERIRIKTNIVRVHDISPSILALMGLKPEVHFDGLNVMSIER
ncbi:MAG: alkaline phosphatase family protein [Nitrososphaeria archaeon]